MSNVTVGVYRHFKGGYYFVTGLARSSEDYDVVRVQYMDICHPELGYFSRPLEDFISDHDTEEQFGDEMTLYIKDRIDNVTGQTHRFEKVKDLNFQLGSVSTEQLIDELAKRVDSPIHELDIEGLRSPVCYTDYVIGEEIKETSITKKGIYTIAPFDDRESAEVHLATHKHKRNTGLFKRTFIRVV